MDIILNNFQWMGWNVFLAIIPLFLAILFTKENRKWVGSLIFIIWLLFVPNTIYLITDLQHLPQQLISSDLATSGILVFQYLILVFLGVYTYLAAMKPITRLIKNPETLIVPLNFFIAFGVAIGKVQRTDSWDVITHPIRVVSDVNSTLSSWQLMLFVIGFGILINFIWYFGRMLDDKK